jgi:hypothetical protein
VMEARETDKTKVVGEVLSPGQMSRELDKSKVMEEVLNSW